MSSPKHIARTYLGWFSNEASVVEDPVYAPGTDFVQWYRNPQTGATENAVAYVSKLAYSRLPIDEAQAVVEAARKLLRPEETV